jgi:hypothetical protein
MLEDGIDEQAKKQTLTGWEKRMLRTLIDLLVRNERGELKKIKESCKQHGIQWQSLYADMLS